ncbi:MULTISPECIES: VOC family protein [Pseudomonas]|nr:MULTISPECIES: VOC family protein [Pseudomonas]
MAKPSPCRPPLESEMPLTCLLRCNDLSRTREHYQRILGFAVSDGAESTLLVQLQDCRLTFTEQDLWGSAPGCTGTLYFALEDVQAYFDSIKERADIAWPLQDMPYGTREFGIRDCNGYYLAFMQGQPVPG